MSDDKLEEDLARLDPRLWQEVRARAAALRSFQKIEKPTRSDAQHAANEIGISMIRLQQLARLWNREGSLTALVPYLDRASRPKLNPELEVLVSNSIEEVINNDPGAKADRAVELVRARCLRSGLKPPSRPTVRKRFEDRLRQPGPPIAHRSGEAAFEDVARGIVFDRAAIAIPVTAPTGTKLPLVTMAIDRQSQAVLALEPAEDDEPLWAAIASILVAFVEDSDSSTSCRIEQIEADRDEAPEWSELAAILDNHGVKLITAIRVGATGGRHIRKLVGTNLAALPLWTHGLIPGGQARYDRWLSRGNTLQPVNEDALLRIARHAARHHNDALPFAPQRSSSNLSPALADALRAWLDTKGCRPSTSPGPL